MSTFPYRRFIEYIDCKFYERSLSVLEVDARGTSITCPVCSYMDKGNRVDKEEFRCKRCGFTFNAQYVACLNLFSRSNDGMVAIRGGRPILITRKTAQVVAVDVAPDEPSNHMRWLKEKLVPKLIISNPSTISIQANGYG